MAEDYWKIVVDEYGFLSEFFKIFRSKKQLTSPIFNFIWMWNVVFSSLKSDDHRICQKILKKPNQNFCRKSNRQMNSPVKKSCWLRLFSTLFGMWDEAFWPLKSDDHRILWKLLKKPNQNSCWKSNRQRSSHIFNLSRLSYLNNTKKQLTSPIFNFIGIWDVVFWSLKSDDHRISWKLFKKSNQNSNRANEFTYKFST